jgi:hypothetical protein
LQAKCRYQTQCDVKTQDFHVIVDWLKNDWN